MPVLIATNNAHKVAEIAAILRPRHTRLLTPRHCGVSFDPEENGGTYSSNALIKARAGCAASGLPTLADDSGLEVAALNGEPGLHSSRWLAELPQADKNLRLVELVQAAGGTRDARFVCAVALVLPAGETYEFYGECPGAIADGPRGGQGFGYDPVFLVAGQGCLAMAELGEAKKNELSHRARALLALRAHPVWSLLDATADGGAAAG